jgi:hypothetical protein
VKSCLFRGSYILTMGSDSISNATSDLLLMGAWSLVAELVKVCTFPGLVVHCVLTFAFKVDPIPVGDHSLSLEWHVLYQFADLCLCTRQSCLPVFL